MPKQKPSIGRVVHYVLTDQDTQAIRAQRAGRVVDVSVNPVRTVAVHYGRTHFVGDVVSLDITRVTGGNIISGQARLDGNDVLWVTDVPNFEVDEDSGAFEIRAGTWHWPPRV